tara:strand:+ start:592 stop:882 length:291 start_codon:yes stop_codon:yes gene_type:complete
MKAAGFTAAAFLFLGVLSLPSEYYSVMRWVVTAVGVYFAYYSFNNSEPFWGIVFGCFSLIFNPIVPLYLYDKFTWVVIDLVAGLCFITYSKELKEE